MVDPLVPSRGCVWPHRNMLRHSRDSLHFTKSHVTLTAVILLVLFRCSKLVLTQEPDSMYVTDYWLVKFSAQENIDFGTDVSTQEKRLAGRETSWNVSNMTVLFASRIVRRLIAVTAHFSTEQLLLFAFARQQKCPNANRHKCPEENSKISNYSLLRLYCN